GKLYRALADGRTQTAEFVAAVADEPGALVVRPRAAAAHRCPGGAASFPRTDFAGCGGPRQGVDSGHEYRPAPR
ncbi:hypothetical protein ACWCPC_11540, partial [Streptomyces decoyicus]